MFRISIFLISIFILYSVDPLIVISISGETEEFPSYEQLNNATKYLLNHFNNNINLVYESEDKGRHWLLNEYPELEGYLFYNNTYWIYSDNLFAYLGLETFSPYHSKLIKKAYDNYVLSVGYSNLFEVLEGKKISSDILDPKNIYYGNFSNRYLFARAHTQQPPLDFEKYADLICYKALNLYFNGKYTSAKDIFYKAYNMFDGKGLYDEATKNDGFYANYKLALLIYTSKILDIKLPNNNIEKQLWAMQSKTNGGIVSLANLNGEPIGSCNAETTSLTLMVYNNDLINRLGAYRINLLRTTTFYIIVGVLIALFVILPIYRWVR